MPLFWAGAVSAQLEFRSVSYSFCRASRRFFLAMATEMIVDIDGTFGILQLLRVAMVG
jgi:hypothetical protein